MSMTETAPVETGAAAPEAATTAPVETAAPTTTETTAPATAAPMTMDDIEASISALEADPSTTEKSLSELRRMRPELKRLREEAAPLRETFDGLQSEDQQAFQHAIALYKSDPAQFAEWALHQSKTLLGERFDALATGKPAEAAAAPADAEGETPEDLSDPAVMRAFIAKQVSEGVSAAQASQNADAETRALHGAISEKLTSLGLNVDSPTTQAILFQAKALNGDPIEAIGKAHEAFQADLIEQAQKYAAKKQAEAGSSVPTNGQATAGSDNSPPLTPQLQAERDMKARLDAAFSANLA